MGINITYQYPPVVGQPASRPPASGAAGRAKFTENIIKQIVGSNLAGYLT
jgi:hypothetical protein